MGKPEVCEKCTFYEAPTADYEYPKGECKLIIVGESLGQEEVAAGKPFVGPSGKFVNNLIEFIGFSRERDVFITNAIRCYPGSGKNKKSIYAKDLTRCRKHFLLPDLEKFKGVPILVLGGPATKSLSVLLFGKSRPLKELRGHVYSGNGYIIGFINHPSWYIRNGKDSSSFISDAKNVVYKLLENIPDANLNRKDLPFNYHVLSSKEAIKILEKADKNRKIIFDIETNGKQYQSNECIVTCLGFAFEDDFNNVYVVKVDKDFPEFVKTLSDFGLIAHNSKFDINTLKWIYGINFKVYGDTLLASYAIDQTRDEYTLESLVLEHCPQAALWEAGIKGSKKISNLEGDNLYRYNAIDVYATSALWKEIFPKLKDHEFLYYNILLPANEFYMDVEFYGACADKKRLEYIHNVCEKEIELLSGWFDKSKEVLKFIETTGKSFNPNSPKHVLDILQNVLKIRYYNVRKRKEILIDTTNSKTIVPFADKYEFIKRILWWRKVNKYKTTYSDKILSKLIKEDNVYKCYPSIFLHRTASGRTASSSLLSEPVSPVKRAEDDLSFNFQNLPKDSLFRGIIIAPEGYLVISFDYSTLEMRVVAAIARDPVLRDIFLSGKDFHTSMASIIYHIPYEEVPKDLRQNAKRAVFGLLYGASPEMLVETFGISLEEAQEIIDQYLGVIPVTRNWIEETKQFIENNGYVVTPFGRKRLLSDKFSNKAKRQGVNTIIQATASDLMLLAARKIRERLIKEGLWPEFVRAFVTVHDEKAAYVKDSPEVCKKYIEIASYEATIGIRESFSVVDDVMWDIPLEVEFKVGKRWMA